ncbi:gamma-glutamylcyclotransferase family protein [Consotaella salsifontis]|uniref:Gamma-glutamyl cyclotransferase, AIG2-like n=1 Tax=Consotaella salsifontis TaxID=1365950 RepID=A0A1T4N1P3_9HYPH|nr:gamma-glutamylcyclotransferase family protein [Consotaella salsifontis]SJZ73249.1 Gamma-glutamyl cyclotransferase, AIG2-like [Consotaella salsifontis]
MTTDNQKEYLFTYGTLQQDGVQQSTFGRVLEGKEDELPGYMQQVIEITDPEVTRKSGRHAHRIAVKCDDPTKSVKGKVLEVTKAELQATDEYEVSDYKRTRVTLKSGTEAWAYVKRA